MLVNRLIESHFTMGALFTVLSLLMIAPSLGWLDPDNLESFAALLLLIVAIPFMGLILKRRVWLISPVIGFACTFLSLLYTRSFTSFINPGSCSATSTDRGYPYWWINQFRLNGNSCLVLILPASTYPRIVFFFLDTCFYMALLLAVAEFYLGLQNVASRNPLR